MAHATQMQPGYLTDADWEIVTTLVESDLTLTPQVIAYNAGLSRHWCNERLRHLRLAGLVSQPDRGLYEANPITELVYRGEPLPGDAEQHIREYLQETDGGEFDPEAPE